jgi:hypothetical protein
MKTLKTTMFVTACMAMMCACTDQSTLDENQGSNESNELVELKINPSIALTRAAVTSENGSDLGSIAVYSSGTSNNYAIYEYSDGSSSWGAKGEDKKIYLSKEAVTIFAYYPAYSDAEESTALEINTTDPATAPGTSSTINVSLNEGDEDEGKDGNQIYVASATVESSVNDLSSNNTINTASADVDYMYAVDGSNSSEQPVNAGVENESQPTASSASGSSSVSLKMKHAMASVSFKVKIEKYDKAGKLTKIVLKNTSDNTTLNKGTSTATMNISSGAITITGSSAATFTRFIYTGTPSAVGFNSYSNESSTAGYALKAGTASPAFSILTYPNDTADKSTVEVAVTIDGQTYSKALPNSNQAWTAGKNHVYTLTLTGGDLSISEVKIAPWEDTTMSGDITLQ